MTIETSDLLPGYRVDPTSGAWATIPWPSDPDERMELVRNSLGPALIDWAEWRTDEPGLTHYLTGRQWSFTPGQKRFIVLWWHLSPEGRFTYRRGVKRGAKGTGKDPLAGAFANMELCGPVELFDWDDRSGRPVGRRRGLPLVQITSNSEAQSKDLLRVANALWGQRAREFYNIDCGDTRTALRDTFGRIEVNTASEKSNEGDPVTLALLNETHHMVEAEAKRLSAQARRNAAKSPAQVQARVLEFTNAHASGRASVAEGSLGAWQKQLGRGFMGRQDILYDSIEAPPSTNILTPEGRMAGLRAAYSDAPWADLERMSDEMLDDDQSIADTIRYYLNGVGAEEDAWVDPQFFDALADPKPVEDGDQIALFLDCSKSEDATGLVACRLADMHVFDLGVWQQPYGWNSQRHGRWLVDRSAVDLTVRSTFKNYSVVWFGVDPSPARDEDESSYWMPTIDSWHQDLGKKLPVWATPGFNGHSVLYDLRLSAAGGVKRNFEFTKAAEQVQAWVNDDARLWVESGRELPRPPFSHSGSVDLRTHVFNARTRPNKWGRSLAKVSRDSDKKIDLAVCIVGAVLGARTALNSGKVKPTQPLQPVHSKAYVGGMKWH